jgi:Spy/CpxP family protein refolding chaperone
MKYRIPLLAAAMLASSIAVAQPPSGARPAPDMERLGILLDLNDFQKGEVQKILEAQHQEMLTIREQARASGTRPSREEMQQRREQFRQETLTKLQTVLTPEQLKKFEVLHDHPVGAGPGPGRQSGAP